MALYKTRFRDIALREIKEHLKLTNRKAQLDKKIADNLQLSQTEQDELSRINRVLKIIDGSTNPKETANPLFAAVRYLMQDEDCADKETLVGHDNGKLMFSKLASDSSKTPKMVAITSPKDENIVLAALTLGLLEVDGAQAPPIIAASAPTNAGFCIVPDRGDALWNSLSQMFYSALGEAKGMDDLARLVLPILADEGNADGRGGRDPEVMTAEYAQVMRELVRRGVSADEIQLRRRVNEALNRFQHIDEVGPYTRVATRDNGINPPDLEALDRYNLVPENIRLMGVMFVSAMFDEIRAFQCLDYCVEASQRGEIVLIGNNDVGQWLFNYWRDAPNRLSDLERRTFLSQTIGVPGGEPGYSRNEQAQPLMMHLCSNVSKLMTQYREAENLSFIFQQRARKAARDLAANLSLHGYGMAYYAAGELQKQLNFVIDVLSHPEIRSNFGARDMWQVCDQINTLHLPGGPKNTLKYQTLATCGTIITAWLANNARHIMSTTGQLLDMGEVRNPSPYPPGQKAITHPNDFDFVNACELWLSESGIPDTETNQYAAMRSAPDQPSRPIQMPSVVQEVLGDFGDLGIGMNRH